MAIHLCVRFLGSGGERVVSLFLRWTQLDAFVASSSSSCHEVATAIDAELALFERSQHELARAQVALRRPVHLALDELFRPDPILVAVDVPSGFVLVEAQAEHRDAGTWAEALQQAQRDLPVAIVQGVSDEARGLHKALETHLGVPQHTDVFHAQYEVTKATSAALAAKVTKAEAVRQKAEAVTNAEFAPEVVWARQQVDQAHMQAQAMAAAVRAVGDAMHPFDLTTGEVQIGEQVAHRLEQAFDQMGEVVEASRLRPRAHDALTKSRALVGKMAATVDWWQTHVVLWAQASQVPATSVEVLLTVLLPSVYLLEVADRSTPQERDRLENLAERKLREHLPQEPGWTALNEAQRRHALGVAEHLARTFLRSSSCVEGRNGQVSLHGHGWRGLPLARLRSLTVVANYLLTNETGKTAYERLFGRRPDDVFEWLLDHVELPAYPALGKRSGRGLLN